MLVKCGDPSVADVGATFSSDTTPQRLVRHARQLRGRQPGPPVGRHRRQQAKATGRADGIWAVETEGARRGTSKLFFRVPVGAEMCGPLFTPDDETLFVAVQHPGEAATMGAGRLRHVRGPVDPLAGLQAGHAAAALGRRHHQAGRRQDWCVGSAASDSCEQNQTKISRQPYRTARG